MTNKNPIFKFFDMLKIENYIVQEDLYRSEIKAFK